MPRSCILVLLDGLGDRAYRRLGGKTPLQAAYTPTLDLLAAKGANGMFWAEGPGLCLPSENAHFAMFGYQREEFPGRGYFEAKGAELPLSPKDVALLAHFATVVEQDGTLRLLRHRPPAASADIEALVQEIGSYEKDNIRIRYHQTHGLNGIVTLHGDVGVALTDSDPFFLDFPLSAVQPFANCSDPAAARTAEVVNSYLTWCYHKLSAHRVNKKRTIDGEPLLNGIVTQRAGRWLPVETFPDRWGMQGLVVASGLVYWGMASFLGMSVQKVRDSDDPGSDLAERLALARERIFDYGFIHVHTKAPDAAGHSKDPRNKVAAIESLDQGLGTMLADLLNDEIVLIVTSDHSTPSSGPLIHSGESVPFMVVGKGIRQDHVTVFDEVSCAGGGLGGLRGKDVMPLVLNWLDRAKLQGLMDAPVNQPYWPGKRTVLRL